MRLQAEQLAYVKQSMKAAKDFDSDYQSTIMELHDDIEQALGSRKNGITDKQIEEQGMITCYIFQPFSANSCFSTFKIGCTAFTHFP